MNVRLGDYVYINKSIGKGSFSRVYKGKNMITNKDVAIKKIKVNKLGKQLLNRLNMEIDLMKKLNHENIIQLYDVLQSNNKKYTFIIMEYCENDSLHKLIKRTLNEQEIHYYMTQLRNGLQYMSDNNIIHRDLKPQNILLTNNYKTLKIVDFGFAKNTFNNISLMDTLCGSPLYMAPEIINKKKYNIQSDLWSIGIILYEMIYQKHPYGKPINILDLMDRLNTRDIQFPDNDMSNECTDLLKLLLHVDVNSRMTWQKFFDHEWFKKDNSTMNVENLDIELEEDSSSDNSSRDSHSIDDDDNDLMFNIDLNEKYNNLENEELEVKWNNDREKYVNKQIDNMLNSDIVESVSYNDMDDTFLGGHAHVIHDYMTPPDGHNPILNGDYINNGNNENNKNNYTVGSLPVSYNISKRKTRSRSIGQKNMDILNNLGSSVGSMVKSVFDLFN